ncbi:Thioredoxin reductase [Candidatus Methylobacter favarea]|uniref:Thioredoxin reductase n=1 Tax=Candidatus Methylobacter favarea TaxID=2707345 RepID=A0A8S0XU40_9GAMM|nr:NAD(P)/FAD-dependent oxidoreductase [Candidatus Methylobacter favarea]CAA9892268.1 Thioredoxin reductase [Candidatus Methylobacter favarea]
MSDACPSPDSDYSNESQKPRYDVVIVGGGPAGLSAALVLGRCLRKVLICDEGQPRNSRAEALKGFLTRDYTPPHELLRSAREELKRYDSVEFLVAKVMNVQSSQSGFETAVSGRDPVISRRLLLATGLIDEIPAIQGFDELYGKSVFLCPYCDAWDVAGKPLAIYGKGERAMEMSRALTAWSKNLILFTDGDSGLTEENKQQLKRNSIELYEENIEQLAGEKGMLKAVVLSNGRHIEREALFFDTPSYQRSDLAIKLGCEFRNERAVNTHQYDYEATNIPGLYAAGNNTGDVIFAIIAAAEGARAAFGINKSLTREDLL